MIDSIADALNPFRRHHPRRQPLVLVAKGVKLVVTVAAAKGVAVAVRVLAVVKAVGVRVAAAAVAVATARRCPQLRCYRFQLDLSGQTIQLLGTGKLESSRRRGNSSVRWLDVSSQKWT